MTLDELSGIKVSADVAYDECLVHIREVERDFISVLFSDAAVERAMEVDKEVNTLGTHIALTKASQDEVQVAFMCLETCLDYKRSLQQLLDKASTLAVAVEKFAVSIAEAELRKAGNSDQEGEK